MKKIYLLLFFPVFLFSQEPYNYRPDTGLGLAVGYMVHELDSTYLCVGRGFNGVYAHEIYKDSGEIFPMSYFKKDGQFIFLEENRNIVEHNSHVYFVVDQLAQLVLVNYDLSDRKIRVVDTIDTYRPNVNSFLHDLWLKGDTLFVSSTIGFDGDTDAHIYKYNLATNETQHIILETPNITDTGGKIVIKENGNIVIASHIRDTTNPYLNYLHLKEIEQSGDVLWEYIHDDDFIYYALTRSILQISGDEYLITCVNLKYINSQVGYYWIPTIMKFDTKSKRIIWTSTLGNDFYFDRGDGFNNVLESHNKDGYMVSGHIVQHDIEQDSFVEVGVVGKIRGNGELIWKRDYQYIKKKSTYHEIRDMLLTSDGNYLCYGEASYASSEDVPEGSHTKQGWIFKIDEQGKIIGDTTSSIEWDDNTLQEQISIFPNPAHDYLYINQDNIYDVVYRVYDLQGKIIDHTTLSRSYQSATWDISDWSSGQYIIHILQDDKVLGNMKVIKK